MEPKYMRYLYSRYLVLCLSMLFVSFAEASPVIEVDKNIIHGKLGDGTPRPFYFEIKNTGDEDLVIKSVTPTCGCTDIKINDKIVSPDATTRIEGAYTTDEHRETYNIRILVVSNASNEPNKLLVISGRNRPRGFTISPLGAEFRSIDGHAPEVQSIHLNLGEGVLDLKHFSVVREGEDLGREYSGVFRVTRQNDIEGLGGKSAGDEIVLDIQAYPSKDHGKYTDTLELDVLINGEMGKYKLPLVLNVVPDIELLPAFIQLKAFNVGLSQSSHRVFLRSQKSSQIKIVTIESSSDAIQIKTRKTERGDWFLYFDMPTDHQLYHDGAVVTIVLDIEGVHKIIEYDVLAHSAPEKAR